MRDNHPRERQKKALERKKASKATYDRVLVVSEGSKTEPNYFEEIRKSLHLQTARIHIQPSELGTSPMNVTDCAHYLFLNGDQLKQISKRAFEKVFVVFDRDDHGDFHQALERVGSLNERYRNNDNRLVTFRAIVSVPSFEFWLLLHFEDVSHLMHRDEVMRRLKHYLPEYEKGQTDIYHKTKAQLPIATARAVTLSDSANPHNEENPYTNVYQLVRQLSSLKSESPLVQ